MDLKDYSTEDLRAELARRDAERAAAIRAAGEAALLDVKHHRALAEMRAADQRLADHVAELREALHLPDASRDQIAARVRGLADEVATLTTRLRLAEASVSLLRADLAASELRERRLRAAEAPGTDDEAVAPWESVGDEDRPIWRNWWTPRRPVLVSRRRPYGWAWFDGASWSVRGYIFAVDAMLAAERATASP